MALLSATLSELTQDFHFLYKKLKSTMTAPRGVPPEQDLLPIYYQTIYHKIFNTLMVVS